MTSTAAFIVRRMKYMLSGWGSIGVIYFLTNSKDQTSAFMLQPSAIDRWFVFDPNALWLYLSFFALVPLGYLLCNEQRAIWLTKAMHLSALGAVSVFVLWPTTMVYPEVTQTSFSASMLELLMYYDSLQNCLPSLHVTLTVLAVWALWDSRRPFRSIFFGIWGIAITISILQLHRHQFIDLVCGALLALCAGLLARSFFTLKSKEITETDNSVSQPNV